MDIIVLTPKATEKELRHILKKLEGRDSGQYLESAERTIIGVISDYPDYRGGRNAIRVMPRRRCHEDPKPFSCEQEFRAEDRQ
jgi:hypothetical protein